MSSGADARRRKSRPRVVRVRRRSAQREAEARLHDVVAQPRVSPARGDRPGDGTPPDVLLHDAEGDDLAGIEEGPAVEGALERPERDPLAVGDDVAAHGPGDHAVRQAMKRPVGTRAEGEAVAPDGGQAGRVHRAGGLVAQLAHVPVGIRQGEADHGHVLADALDLLGPPEREGVVVAVGEQHAVRRHAVEQVVGEVRGEPRVGTVPPAGGGPVEAERHQRQQQDGGLPAAERRAVGGVRPVRRPRCRPRDPRR